MTVVAILGLSYSPNLGDGLIAACLIQGLTAAGAARVSAIDLAGRTAFGHGGGGRGALLAGLDLLPGALRRAALAPVMALMARRAWGPHYRAALEGAQAVVIGGGNLFADHDLNFPTKLSTALKVAADLGLPVLVAGVGVADGWSRRGLRMVEEALRLSPPKGVTVRDEASRLVWNRLFARAAGCEAVVCRDFGLLASRVYPAAATPRAGRRVGLCVMSPVAVRYHTDGGPSARRADAWWTGLAKAAADRGYEIVAFTNGSPEDRGYLNHLKPALRAASAGAVQFAQPETPEALCGLVSSLDGLVAYRMHAVIAAYAYGVPAIPLRWDVKLTSFLSSVGLEGRLADVAADPPEAVFGRLVKAMAEGYDAGVRDKALGEVRAEVAALWGRVRAEAATR